MLCCISRARQFPSHMAETKLSEARGDRGRALRRARQPGTGRPCLEGTQTTFPIQTPGVCDIWKDLSNFKTQAVARRLNPLQCSQCYLHCRLNQTEEIYHGRTPLAKEKFLPVSHVCLYFYCLFLSRDAPTVGKFLKDHLSWGFHPPFEIRCNRAFLYNTDSGVPFNWLSQKVGWQGPAVCGLASPGGDSDEQLGSWDTPWTLS